MVRVFTQGVITLATPSFAFSAFFFLFPFAIVILQDLYSTIGSWDVARPEHDPELRAAR